MAPELFPARPYHAASHAVCPPALHLAERAGIRRPFPNAAPLSTTRRHSQSPKCAMSQLSITHVLSHHRVALSHVLPLLLQCNLSCMSAHIQGAFSAILTTPFSRPTHCCLCSTSALFTLVHWTTTLIPAHTYSFFRQSRVGIRSRDACRRPSHQRSFFRKCRTTSKG